MIKRLKVAISIALVILVIVVSVSVLALNKATKEQLLEINTEQFNNKEFQVVIDAEKGKEFTAYDIEVVDGQAVVNLMVEDEE